MEDPPARVLRTRNSTRSATPTTEKEKIKVKEPEKDDDKRKNPSRASKKPTNTKKRPVEVVTTSLKSKKKNEQGVELYCICQQPNDPTRLMIQCDFCSEWFHTECVGLSEAEVSKIKKWACPKCNKKKATKTINKPTPIPSSSSSSASAAVSTSQAASSVSSSGASSSSGNAAKRKRSASDHGMNGTTAGKGRNVIASDQHSEDASDSETPDIRSPPPKLKEYPSRYEPRNTRRKKRYREPEDEDAANEEWSFDESEYSETFSDDDLNLTSDEGSDAEINEIIDTTVSRFTDQSNGLVSPEKDESGIGKKDAEIKAQDVAKNLKTLRRAQQSEDYFEGKDFKEFFESIGDKKPEEHDHLLTRHMREQLEKTEHEILQLNIREQLLRRSLSFALRKTLEQDPQTTSFTESVLFQGIENAELTNPNDMFMCVGCCGYIASNLYANHVTHCTTKAPIYSVDISRESTVCGFPSVKGGSVTFCALSRGICLEHLLWDKLWHAEITHEEKILSRRKKQLEEEIDLVRGRIEFRKAMYLSAQNNLQQPMQNGDFHQLQQQHQQQQQQQHHPVGKAPFTIFQKNIP